MKTLGPNTAADRALVDELAVLEKQLAIADAEHAKRTAAQASRSALLRAKILGWYDKGDASSSFVAEGKKAAYRISPRSLKTTVLMDRTLVVLGLTRFVKLATMQVGVLKKAAGKKYPLCATAERSGARSLTQVG